MREVVHIFSACLWLQEFYRSLFQVLQQYYVVFANLIVHLALKVVVCLEVAGTDPERLSFKLVGEKANQLHGLASNILPFLVLI